MRSYGDAIMSLTVTDRVLEVCDEYLEQAEIVERFDRAKADLTRRIVTDIRSAAVEASPEWIGLGDIERAKGWSRPTLRRRCRELEPEGRARKDDGGRWEMRRDAARQIPVKESHRREAIEAGDLEATAERLAREE